MAIIFWVTLTLAVCLLVGTMFFDDLRAEKFSRDFKQKFPPEEGYVLVGVYGDNLLSYDKSGYYLYEYVDGKFKLVYAQFVPTYFFIASYGFKIHYYDDNDKLTVYDDVDSLFKGIPSGTNVY